MQQPSADQQRITGEIADYRLDPDGILYAYSKHTRRTISSIRENIQLVKKITGNKKVPLLLFLVNAPVPDKKTREFAAGQLPEVYTAMAMVTKTGLAKFIMRMLFHRKTPPIPMKIFSDEPEAKQWLMQFR